MPLQSNRVANGGSVNSLKVREECKVLVGALNKVVACYRHLAVSVGGSSDSSRLRDELRRTREKAQVVALSNRNKLTAVLKDKQLAKEDRVEIERLWVEFSSCLELLHTDMCKVFEAGQVAHPSSAHHPIIQTGMIGPTAGIASRALSTPNIIYDETVTNKDNLRNDLGNEIEKVDEMINDMEMKVNVLRWTVEASGGKENEHFSPDASSMTLRSMEEGNSRRCCDGGRQFVVSLLLCGVAVVAVTLSVCVVHLA